MSLFGRRRARRAAKDDLAELKEWAGQRRGVEAYVEPQTQFSHPSVVLVAADGESIRRQIPSTDVAADFARKAGIPIYDTNRVGYPQRMRDYAVRQKPRAASSASRSSAPRGTASSAGSSQPSGPRPMSTSERAAVVTLQVSAGVSGDLTTRPDDEQLRRWWKQARARSHPDRRGGDRQEWDEVEQAARTLGLSAG